MRRSACARRTRAAFRAASDSPWNTADRVSATPVDVPDDFFARLAAEFSEREIVELTATIAHENYNSKFNRPLRIEANNFCQIPLPTPEELAARRAG